MLAVGLQGGDDGDLYSHAELLSCGDFPYRTKGARAIRYSAKADVTGPIERIAKPQRRKGCRRCCKRMDGGAESKFSILRYRAWRLLRTFVFLFLLGTITSIFAWSLDRACVAVQTWRVGLIDAWFEWEATDIAPGANATAAAALAALQRVARNATVTPALQTPVQTALIVAQCALFIGVSIALALCALALIAFVETSASGSGIPQMKAVLNGDPIFAGFTTVRCLIAKLLGLMCSWTSGLSVGKEGPFVHIACCIAALMMRIPAFSFYAHSAPHRIGMLGISSAVGVAAVFGSPLGGVLFAIEVVSTFFRVSNLPRMFVSAVVGALAIKTFGYYEGWPLALFSTQFEPRKINPEATLFFLILGICQGVLAGLFIVVVKLIVRLQNRRINAWCGTQKPNGGGQWWCCSGDGDAAAQQRRASAQSMDNVAASGGGGGGGGGVVKVSPCRGCRGPSGPAEPRGCRYHSSPHRSLWELHYERYGLE